MTIDHYYRYQMRKVEEKRRQFFAEIEPILKHKSFIAGIALPSIVFYIDVPQEIKYPEWALDQMAQCDKLIEDVRSRIYPMTDKLKAIDLLK